MSGFAPKRYQQSVLDSVEIYFRACHELPSPSVAFMTATERLWNRSVNYHPIEGFPPDMPYFCLRVPTGGGKTWLAAKSVALVNTHLLKSEYSVILWLVPSKTIREQTLKQLKDRQSPLHAALADAGPVTVQDLEEAKSLTRATVETSTVVIVATVQAFRREDTEWLKVYVSNGALMHHFENLSESQRAAMLRDENGVMPYSLANVLRLRRPFLVVDEAHNSRTPLSFSTFAAFSPSGILELTATPDMAGTPSNVLHSVSAAELKAEQMIKLPILLEAESDWQRCLAYAADKRGQLQAAADKERRSGAPYLRPLVLIQAQPHRANMDTLHVERVRDELTNNHGIRAEQIVIATGGERGLETVEKTYPRGISDENCQARFIITQQALAEGWDCPFAYILVTLAGTQSETAVEQLLGRVLRQPDAKARDTAALNHSYAYVMSADFTAAANQLRDRLVEGAGFERKAVEEFVAAARPEQARLDMGARPGRIVVTPVAVPLAETPQLKQLSKLLRDKLQWDKKAGELIILQPLTKTETTQAAETVGDKAAQAAIMKAGEISRTTAIEIRTSPAERDEVLNVPAIALWVQGELQLFDDPEVLDYPFDLSGYDAHPKTEDLQALGLADRVASGGTIDVTEDGHIRVGFIADLERDLGFAYQPENWDIVRLAAWLCRNLPDAGITHQSKWAFVLKWLQNLLERPGCDLARANRQKFLLRTLLEVRIRELRREAVKRVYQMTLFGEGREKRVHVGGEFTIPFHPQGYAPTTDYDHRYGNYDFKHHYYSRIGDFDSEDEFRCACWLDQQAERGRMDFWVRNLVNKHGCSYFFQKADGKFHPDFLCRLPGGIYLAVEYKGDRWTAAEDDRQIAGLWEELSGGKCRFVMVKDRSWAAIDAKLPSADR
jgi:type III restriction enzyme